ncbi:MAG: hypothetical protein Kow0042_00870 [Calditrichia bacterium]
MDEAATNMILKKFTPHFTSVMIWSLVIFLNLSALAREHQFSGFVFDAHGKQALEGANVYLSAAGCGTVTDSQGQFVFLCKNVSDSDTLVVSFLGYEELKISLNRFQNHSVLYLKPKSLEGEEVIIRAERIDLLKQDIPHAVTTIEFKEIERYGSSEIGDILKPFPSVRVEGNDLDGRQIQIRGSDPDEVNVYLDGILINSVRFDNSADLSIIPVDNIQSLEVLRGGNSVFLGNGAFGGVVNIITRRSAERSFFVKGKLGSFDSKYLIAQMNLPVSRRLVVNYFAQINEQAPTIEYFPGERYSDKTVNKAIETSKQNHNLGVNYFTPSGQFSGRFIGYFFNYQKPSWESEYHNYLSAVSYRGQIFGSRDFDIQLDHLHSRDRVIRHLPGSARYPSDYFSNRLNFKAAKKFVYKASEIQLLSEYFHDDLKTDSRVEDVNYQANLYHAYLYDNRISFAGVVTFKDYFQKIPTLSWKTYVGLRADFLAAGKEEVSPMFGAQMNYDLEHWRFSAYFNYGKNVKYPTLTENAYVHDLTDFRLSDTTQKRLDPEYSQASEVGFSTTYLPSHRPFHSLRFTLALFTRSMYNKLLTRPFDDLVANIQAGRNVTRGLETSVQLNELLRRIDLTASFIQLDITDPLLYAFKPKKDFSARIQYVSPLSLYFTATFFYEGKSIAWYYDRENILQTEKIDPFYDMDVTLGSTIPVEGVEIQLQLAGYNIFDTSGFRYYYLKKRFWQVSLGIKY